MRRTILTAVNALKSHPQTQTPEGLTLTLRPLIAEQMNWLECIPIFRDKHLEFTRELEEQYPGIHFDYGLMDRTIEHQDLWFAEILQDQEVKEKLLEKILGGEEDEEYDLEKVLGVLKETILSGQDIEGVVGMYNRAQNVKVMFRQEIESDSEIQNLLSQSSKNKILVVTHQEVMQALTSTSVSYDENKLQSFYGPYELEGGQRFHNCEILPYNIYENTEDCTYFP